MANILESGFNKADSRNLLKVDTYMAYEYLVKDEKFHEPEVRGVIVDR